MGQKLTYSAMPAEVKRIANDALGYGRLRSILSSPEKFHVMVKKHEGVPIGFGLYHFRTTRMPDGDTLVTGVIDCVCVSAPYRKEGFGTLLTFGLLRKIASYGADRAELMLKTPGLKDRDGEPGVPLAGSEDLLLSLGFRRMDVHEGHYDRISRKFGYDCKLCGNRPDTCLGVLYAIDSREEA